MKLSVSYLNVKKRSIPNVIYLLDKTNVDFIHVDVMDGKYVKNKANSYGEVEEYSYYTKKRLDVHLMVSKPLKYIDDFALLNVFCMTFHLGIKNDIMKVVERVKDYGIKVGIAINPDEDIELIYPYLDKIDLVLIMSVVPGYGGQEFIKDVLPKVKKLRDKIKKDKLDVLISVDGGINLENKNFLGDADILCVGSCITNSENYIDIINEFRE